MIDDVITLYTSTITKDARGVERKASTPRDVFCQVSSVTQSEFFEGGRNGLNPDFRFTIFQADYQDEIKIGYKGKNYAVYRTYIVPGTDYIELYVERQGGTNGQANTD